MIKNNLDKKAILIVEDDNDLAENLATHLAHAGYYTMSVDNVNEACKKLENQKFHMIIVDLHLGDQTGEKVISVIRKDLCGLNIRSPIIVCTGNMTSQKFYQIQHHIDDVMVKPVEVKDVLEKADIWTNKLSIKDHAKKVIRPRNKIQILVADDDINLVDNICAYLKSSDFNPVPCYDILDTRTKLALQKFDCILIDRHMNTRDSTELLISMRQDLSIPNARTPTIMMTGDLNEDFIRFLAKDIQGFIRKPMQMTDLPRYINMVLEKNKVEDSSVSRF